MQNKKAKGWRQIVEEGDAESLKPLTLEMLEKYLEEKFNSYKPRTKQVNLSTGRGGAIMGNNFLRISVNLPELTTEEERQFRNGCYQTSKDSFLEYKGYPFESPDGYRVVKEYGHWYLDQIQDNWAYQVKKLTEEEAQELIKEHKQKFNGTAI